MRKTIIFQNITKSMSHETDPPDKVNLGSMAIEKLI